MKPAYLIASTLALVVAGLSCSKATDPPAADDRQDENHMTLIDFNGASLPTNRSGDTYPSIYMGAGSRGRVGLDSTDAVTGNSLRADITGKGLYLQFNPYNADDTRGFARELAADAARWRFNTYNRMSFWIKRRPSASPLGTGGRTNVEFGTYVKRVANPDRRSDEAGGNHCYHMINLPNDGNWIYVIINMHPAHRRGDSGNDDPGDLPHPTGEPEYNYFDALTRFYIDDTNSPSTGTFQVDDFRFYREPAAENDVQVYSLTGTYDPISNRLTVTWCRPKDENTIAHEVRYAFSDIHDIGWDAARPAPKGVIKPPGWQGYNGMVYATTALPLEGHPAVYIAIKPRNSRLFSQIAIPLRGMKSPENPSPGGAGEKGR
jgi:hypothetical protein